MPFGKYRGRPLTAVDDKYLEWLCSIDLREPLLSAVVAEIDRREAMDATDAPPAVADIITVGFRTLAQRAHPDHGGDTATMRALLEGRAWLRTKLQGVLA
jgi:hypothetical protein